MIVRLSLILLSASLMFACKMPISDNAFVRVQNTDFYIKDSKYNYIGCNYWYGGYLYTDSAHDGKKRLMSELDFLVSKGITNLRVFFCGEGDSSYAFRIHPSVQPRQGIYREDILIGFDYLLNEAAKRNIKLVCVLNNNWEWSGGFGQYLEWNGFENPPLPKTRLWDWDHYCKYIAQFYSSDSCLKYSNQWVEKIVSRINSINGKAYKEDPCIMAWELANEPRPMDSLAINAYMKWVETTSTLIKQIDKNHLVTIGVEGIISTRYSDSIFTVIHKLNSIDYATMHLWPKTWQWYNGNFNHAVTDTTLRKTTDYIQHHAALCIRLKKPLVIEEFGLHRDENSFQSNSTTFARDKYYRHVFSIGKQYNIAGYNFWGYAGLAENTNPDKFMQKGMAYSADPPQEEQGLYSVFASDSSTWKLIKDHIKK